MLYLVVAIMKFINIKSNSRIVLIQQSVLNLSLLGRILVTSEKLSQYIHQTYNPKITDTHLVMLYCHIVQMAHCLSRTRSPNIAHAPSIMLTL